MQSSERFGDFIFLLVHAEETRVRGLNLAKTSKLSETDDGLVSTNGTQLELLASGEWRKSAEQTGSQWKQIKRVVSPRLARDFTKT
eukprot:5639640-Amphidinium_carterae.1